MHPSRRSALALLLVSLAVHSTQALSDNKEQSATPRPLVGLALNGFLLGSNEFSGTLSFFPRQLPIEIAIPVYHGSFTDYEQSDIDLRLRYYLRRNQPYNTSHGASGMYVSLDARYSKLQGLTRIEFNNTNSRTERYYDNTSKLGIGVGLGIRGVFYYKWKVYFGASLNFGRYLTGDHDLFSNRGLGVWSSGGTSDDRNYVDLEFLKVGMVF